MPVRPTPVRPPPSPHRPLPSPARRAAVEAATAVWATALAACAAGTAEPARTAPATPPPPAAAPDTTVPVPAGWVWTFRDGPPRALFGPPASEAVLVVACRAESAGTGTVVFTLYAPADSGATNEMVISGNGTRVTVPLEATSTELGPDWIWRGAGAPSATAPPFTAGPGPVTFAVEGSAVWTVPDPGPARSVVSACRPGPDERPSRQKGSPTPK